MSEVDNNAFNISIENTGVNGNPQDAGMAHIPNTDGYTMLIDDNGHINAEYGHANNLTSSCYHESRHRYDETTRGGKIGEVNAILQQTQHESWWGTTDTFAYSQASYAARKLNEALNVNLNDYVNKLNDAFIGRASFMIEKGKVVVSNSLKGIVIYGKKK